MQRSQSVLVIHTSLSWFEEKRKWWRRVTRKWRKSTRKLFRGARESSVVLSPRSTVLPSFSVLRMIHPLSYSFQSILCLFFFHLFLLRSDDVCIRWHSAGTYDLKTKTGGPFGTIRLPQELADDANKGLDIAVRLLEPIKDMFPILSYADFYQVTFQLISEFISLSSNI